MGRPLQRSWNISGVRNQNSVLPVTWQAITTQRPLFLSPGEDKLYWERKQMSRSLWQLKRSPENLGCQESYSTALSLGSECKGERLISNQVAADSSMVIAFKSVVICLDPTSKPDRAIVPACTHLVSNNGQWNPSKLTNISTYRKGCVWAVHERKQYRHVRAMMLIEAVLNHTRQEIHSGVVTQKTVGKTNKICFISKSEWSQNFLFPTYLPFAWKVCAVIFNCRISGLRWWEFTRWRLGLEQICLTLSEVVIYDQLWRNLLIT